MKKALGLAVIMLFVGSTTAMAQIGGTGHDFRNATWAGGTGTTTLGATGDVCAPCHTPHSSITGAKPLWNHALAATTGWTMYTSPTMDATAITAPSGSSLACLGCHDGVTALDSYGGVTGSTVMSGAVSGYIGKDLSYEHPVSIDYASAITNGDANLHPAGDAGVAGLLRDTGLVQCSSCHEPHNQGADPNYGFLREDNTASAMCLTCHDKL